MTCYHFVQAPGRPPYADAVAIASQSGEYDKLCAAVAYATLGGVTVITEVLAASLGPAWQTVKKEWLVGIDYCRTDPPALDALAALPKSKVRVPNGVELVSRSGCHPTTTFHPKLFMFSGKERIAVVCGSGNLSASGLKRGCECGSAYAINKKDINGANPGIASVVSWFSSAWQDADSLDSLRDLYAERCSMQVRDKACPPTDDDVPESTDADAPARRALSELQLRQMRVMPNLWITAGTLGRNLGPNRPGNQLDMKKYTRVFFGRTAEKVPPDTLLGTVTLVWNGQLHSDRMLRFGNNGMDKLNVPVAPSEQYYAGRTLLFTRRIDGSFAFEAGTATQANQWRKRSEQIGMSYQLSNTRSWGLF